MPYLYLIKAKRRRLYKIGITSDLIRRRKQIKRSIDSEVVFFIFVAYAANYERWLHRRYKHRQHKLKINGGSEWFKFWLPLGVVFWMLLFFMIEWCSIFLFLTFLIWI